NYATSNVSATAGSDYTATSGTLTFAPGEITKTVSVVVSGDTLYETNETFRLDLSNSVNALLTSPTYGLATITNDDVAPTISIADTSSVENNSGTVTLMFAVTLSALSGAPTVVNYAPAGGTATNGSDYANTGGSFTIPAGQTSFTLYVTVYSDTVYEANETGLIDLTSLQNATIADGEAVGTILNDDWVPVNISDATVTEGNTGTPAMTFTVTMASP